MRTIYKISSVVALLTATVSCNKFLDREPLADILPYQYFNTEQDLATYTITRYSFPTHKDWNAGTFIEDNHTDNQATANLYYNPDLPKTKIRIPIF